MINLQRLLTRPPTQALVTQIFAGLGGSLCVQDEKGKTLCSCDGARAGEAKRETHSPVIVENQAIGSVVGDEKSAPVAAHFLTHLAQLEYEKKCIAKETLDRYKEITLLHHIAENIGSCLDLKEVGKLILNEAKNFLNATAGSMMLLDDKGRLEIVSAFGREYPQKADVGLNEGIAGNVAIKGKPVIVNDVSSDPRFVPGKKVFSSMMCAPLKTKDRVIGVINISNDNPHVYSSGDIKLLSIFASEAAAAVDNAMLHENRIKQERWKSNLERYIAPQIVSAVMNEEESISLRPERKHITILFSDIRKFSSICEELEPERTVEYLNEYFTHMTRVIFEHEGTLNKFVGDMIVALFGAPTDHGNNERKAINTAIGMQKCLQTMPAFWIRNNFHTGIGISSGPVVVGNIGSPQHMDYTAIGDEVNVAERLQSIAKGGQIFVTNSVYEITQDLFEFKRIGSVDIKGKKLPIEVFEVIY